MPRSFPLLQMRGRRLFLAAVLMCAVTIAIIVQLALYFSRADAALSNPKPIAGPAPAATEPAKPVGQVVQLSDSQLNAIKTAPVSERDFAVEREAVGSIDFNQDLNVQVFSPYQGRIVRTYADLGDEVSRGQMLFTIESADFIAAQSNLIGAAATLDQTASALERAKRLYASRGIDQNDYETAVANQQTAEGALRAARDAVAIFGKSESEIDRIVTARQVEPELVVRSPIGGRITARNAAPGLLEQPGVAPAPYAVSDLSSMWMLAEVTESDSPEFRVGQALTVSVFAYPGRMFSGKVTRLGATVDPNSRRVLVRSEIKDPKHELLPGMFASFVIQTAAPVRSVAVPVDGVVREGDGTMSVWVMLTDRHNFERRTVKVGLQGDGYDQITEGLDVGQTVAIDGAILLSNILFGGAS